MQYLCIDNGSLQRWLMVAALGLGFTGHAQGGEIYRSVAADGTVSYSDQPSPGASQVPELIVSPTTAADRAAARSEADARIAQQLDLAAELAAERLARSAQRDNAALVRAELQESKARQQALTAEREALANTRNDSYPYQSSGYWYPRRHRDRYDDYRHPTQPPELGPELPPRPSPKQSRPLPRD